MESHMEPYRAKCLFVSEFQTNWAAYAAKNAYVYSIQFNMLDIIEKLEILDIFEVLKIPEMSDIEDTCDTWDT